MKNRLLYILLVVLAGFTACDNNDDTDYLFDKSINERFDELKSEYKTKLTTPENGWVGYYNANGHSGAYTLLLKFDESGNVIMHSDYDSGNANDTITYGIKKKQDIVLVFESWSVLHSIFEMNNNNNGGEFVFNFSSVGDDEIILTSKKDNGYNGDEVTEIILHPATDENWDVSDLLQNSSRLIGGAANSFFRNFKDGDSTFASFVYNSTNRTAVISYLENEEVKSITTPIAVNSEGFNFMEEVTIEGKTFQYFAYNESDEEFVDIANNSIKLSFDNAPAFTLDGTTDLFLAENFKNITAYSPALEPAITLLKQDIPNFSEIQLYTEWGYCLVFAPETEGGNWGGFTGFHFTKVDEDEIQITWDMLVYSGSPWWKLIYNNPGGKAFLAFLLDENGLYIIPADSSNVFLVSKSDPSLYCQVKL